MHEKQIGTRLEYRSPEYLALKKAEKEWKASPRLVPTYFPRPSGDELEAQWMEWHGLEPPSLGRLRPPAGGGERGCGWNGRLGACRCGWSGRVGACRGVSAPAAPACPDGLAQG